MDVLFNKWISISKINFEHLVITEQKVRNLASILIRFRALKVSHYHKISTTSSTIVLELESIMLASAGILDPGISESHRDVLIEDSVEYTIS